jgi:hypothetical protein
MYNAKAFKWLWLLFTTTLKATVRTRLLPSMIQCDPRAAKSRFMVKNIINIHVLHLRPTKSGWGRWFNIRPWPFGLKVRVRHPNPSTCPATELTRAWRLTTQTSTTHNSLVPVPLFITVKSCFCKKKNLSNPRDALRATGEHKAYKMLKLLTMYTTGWKRFPF